MSDLAIRVENLGKKYRIGGRQLRYKRFTETVMDTFSAPVRRLRNLGKPTPPEEIIWALKDVSFEVKRGEVVGIIGRNGAGKTTLLKILSRITEPTEGRAEIHGRVGSLLEVGTGFHPELTGRENVYLSGVILGMKRAEIDRKFGEIVEFSGVDKFIDTPVKRFSSGMQVRLAFAVAAHLEPEIMLVDEVLAVGDAAFQKKCLGKMDSVARAGRTVLFVSHNMGAISRLCNRAIMLESGEVLADGAAAKVVDTYISRVLEMAGDVPIAQRRDRRGDGRIRFCGLHWETPEEEVVSVLQSGGDYRVVLDYECPDGLSKDHVRASFGIKDRSGPFLLLHQTDFSDQDFGTIPPKGRFICRIPNLPLAAGQYSVTIYVGSNRKACDVVENATQVIVESGDFFGTGHPGRPGLCKWLAECHWELRA